MMNFWDSRYATSEYVYGTAPNEFVKEQLQNIPRGKILFPAEGEGRNSVFAAKIGFDVYAFDSSEVGRAKALELAKESNVKINYLFSDYEKVDYPENYFDVIAFVFAHMHPEYRTKWHRKLQGFLKPGGRLILEGFAKDQLKFNSGGPKDINMLFSEEELMQDFNQLENVTLQNAIISLNEGDFHNGLASVIRLTGIKK